MVVSDVWYKKDRYRLYDMAYGACKSWYDDSNVDIVIYILNKFL